MANEAFVAASNNNVATQSAKISQPLSINVNSGQVTSSNSLSLGVMLDFEWNTWTKSSVLQQVSSAANFKLIRIFNVNMEPCLAWDDTSKTGTFDWAKADSIVAAIFSSGAEPQIILGYLGSGGYLMLPPGMQVTSTGLPSPSSWAAYSEQWTIHFKQTGAKVRYYEIFNEPWNYFASSDWTRQPDYTRLRNYRDVFNAAQTSMLKQNPDVLLGFDGCNRKYVLTWWLNNAGADLGFVSFHKYDQGVIEDFTDAQMFDRAETFMINTDRYFYGISAIRQMYFSARGEMIQVINSESNYNSAYATGTDPEIQQMAGTVWYALKLRAEILSGLDYDVYYTFASDGVWQQAQGTGLGFGMVNLDNNAPWYPYFVAKMIGSNLAVGDKIVNSRSSSANLESIAWIHNNMLNIMVINKANLDQTLTFSGINTALTALKIDNSKSYLSPSAQTLTITPNQPITLNGYTVILAQTMLS